MPNQRRKAIRAEPGPTGSEGRVAPSPSPQPAPAPAPMEAVGDWRLPTELRRFFRSRTAQSLLIRGAPGTGKTTLALTLLSGLPIPGFYVSTRVNYAELLEHFPWLKDKLPPNRVVDAQNLWPGLDGRKEYSELIRKFTTLTPDTPEFGDLDRFLALPTGIQEVFSRVPPGERSALVVDSWDGLIEPYLGHPSEEPSAVHRLRIENALMSVLSQANVHALLIRESPSASGLEFLVHGVVELRRADHEGMVLRELVYHKLRGVPLQSSSSLYTLDGGRFSVIPRAFPTTEAVLEEKFQVRENPTMGLSWGAAELDRVVGSLQPGQPVLVEVDTQAGRASFRPIGLHLTAQAIASGWDVAVLPDPAGAIQPFARELEFLVSPAAIAERFAAFPIPPVVVPGTPTPPATRELVDRMKESMTGRSLVRVSLNALAPAFGNPAEYLEAVVSLANRVRERGGILLFHAPTGTLGLAETSNVVQAHLKLGVHDRTLIFYSLRPSSPALGVLANVHRGEYPALRLIPIR